MNTPATSKKPKKLFEVEVEDHLYVMAENENQAERIARSESDGLDLDYNACIATGYYGAWTHERPINADSDDRRTVSEIINELKKEQERKKYIKKHYQELPFENAE